MAIDLELVNIEGKREEYRNYIEEHISNVKTVWNNIIRNPVLFDYIQSHASSGVYINIISQNIEMHDQSKYSDIEFEAYRKYFHPVNQEEKEKNLVEFQIAWQHHKDNNKHHWDYWYERGIRDEMPFEYIIEMFCDHAAMSMKFGGTAIEWMENEFKNNKVHIGEKQKEIYFEFGKLYYSEYKK